MVGRYFGYHEILGSLATWVADEVGSTDPKQYHPFRGWGDEQVSTYPTGIHSPVPRSNTALVPIYLARKFPLGVRQGLQTGKKDDGIDFGGGGGKRRMI